MSVAADDVGSHGEPPGRLLALTGGAALAGWAVAAVVTVLVGLVVIEVVAFEDPAEGLVGYFFGALAGTVLGAAVWLWRLAVAVRVLLPAGSRLQAVVGSVAATGVVGLLLGAVLGAGSGGLLHQILGVGIAALVVPAVIVGWVRRRAPLAAPGTAVDPGPSAPVILPSRHVPPAPPTEEPQP